METENFKVDMGTIWIPLERARTMLDMSNEATYVTFVKNISTVQEKGKWIYRDVNYLMRDMEAMIEADEPGAQIMYIILLALAGMGIFNSQILSIFRRRKEIGTLMALGMTRSRVVTIHIRRWNECLFCFNHDPDFGWTRFYLFRTLWYSVTH